MVLDILFGDVPLGLDILHHVRDAHPLLPVVVMTNVGGDFDILERAMELGATDYLVKTPGPSEIERLADTYFEPAGQMADYAIWGNSRQIRHVRALITRAVAAGDCSVLIVGESGTGKELVARAVHRQGRRRSGPFVDKNCAYASTELLDSDLFGHEKGAFTGAERRHIGRLESADGGVLFLDEVSSMPHELQGKLLRVLETHRFTRLGSRDDVTSDFQLVCATNEDPEALVASGRLRPDLFYRLNEFVISLPPLRARPDDIAILAELFLRRVRSKHADSGTSFRGERFSDGALGALMRYHWPGNVRQLKNVVSRAVMLSRQPVIDESCLPDLINAAEAVSETVSNVVAGSAPGPASDVMPAASWPAIGDEPAQWPLIRLRSELEIALDVKRRVVGYKGKHWKAEFMRVLYPECRTQSAKGFTDLMRRLTQGPWGSGDLERDPVLKRLLDELLS